MLGNEIASIDAIFADLRRRDAECNNLRTPREVLDEEDV
jgi:hypothetical protein